MEIFYLVFDDVSWFESFKIRGSIPGLRSGFGAVLGVFICHIYVHIIPSFLWGAKELKELWFQQWAFSRSMGIKADAVMGYNGMVRSWGCFFTGDIN